MSRYSNIEYISNLHWLDGTGLINRAINVETEKWQWDLYLTQYPNMDKNNFLSFADYKKKLTEPKINNTLSAKEIIERAESITKVKKGIHEGIVRGE